MSSLKKQDYQNTSFNPYCNIWYTKQRSWSLFYLFVHSLPTAVFNALFIKKPEGKAVNGICVRWCLLGWTKLSGRSRTLPKHIQLGQPRPQGVRNREPKEQKAGTQWWQTKGQAFRTELAVKREGTSESRAGGKDLSFKEQLLKGKKYFESFSLLFFCNSFELSLFQRWCVWSYVAVNWSFYTLVHFCAQ